MPQFYDDALNCVNCPIGASGSTPVCFHRQWRSVCDTLGFALLAQAGGDTTQGPVIAAITYLAFARSQGNYGICYYAGVLGNTAWTGSNSLNIDCVTVLSTGVGP